MDENEFFDRRDVSPDQLSIPGMEIVEAKVVVEGPTLDGGSLKWNNSQAVCDVIPAHIMTPMTPVEKVTFDLSKINLYRNSLLDHFAVVPNVLVNLTDYRWLIINNQLSFQKFGAVHSVVLAEPFREQVGNYILLQGREGFYYLVDAVQMNPFLGQILDAPPPVTEI